MLFLFCRVQESLFFPNSRLIWLNRGSTVPRPSSSPRRPPWFTWTSNWEHFDWHPAPSGDVIPRQLMPCDAGPAYGHRPVAHSDRERFCYSECLWESFEQETTFFSVFITSLQSWKWHQRSVNFLCAKKLLASLWVLRMSFWFHLHVMRVRPQSVLASVLHDRFLAIVTSVRSWQHFLHCFSKSTQIQLENNLYSPEFYYILNVLHFLHKKTLRCRRNFSRDSPQAWMLRKHA